MNGRELRFERMKVLSSIKKFNPPISRQIILGTFLVIFVCTIAEVAMRGGWLDTLDDLYYDFWHSMAGLQAEPKEVAIDKIALKFSTLVLSPRK